MDVNIQYQSWDDLLQKFDAVAAAGHSTPDVIELGGTTDDHEVHGCRGALGRSRPGNYPELEVRGSAA